MKPAALWLTVALLLGVASCERSAPPADATDAADAAALTIYVVRHAEKQALEGEDDPPLTPRGEARARGLVDAVPADQVVTIITSPFERTRATVRPLAEVAGVELAEIDGHAIDAIASRARQVTSGAVVISAHSDTVPEILEALGVAEPVVIASDDYGDLFVVHITSDGATLERRRFGD